MDRIRCIESLPGSYADIIVVQCKAERQVLCDCLFKVDESGSSTSRGLNRI